MPDEFVTRTATKLETLKAEDEHLLSMARGIQEKRQAIVTEIDKLTTAVEIYCATMGVAPPWVQQPAPEGTLYERLRKMTIPEGCGAVLRAHGGRTRTVVIRDALIASGKTKVRSGVGYAMVEKAMSRFPDRFRKVAPGEWAEIGVGGHPVSAEPRRSSFSANGAGQTARPDQTKTKAEMDEEDEVLRNLDREIARELDDDILPVVPPGGRYPT